MHTFRGIRMMMVRMIICATRHHELRATCFSRGGVPTVKVEEDMLVMDGIMAESMVDMKGVKLVSSNSRWLSLAVAASDNGLHKTETC